MYGLDVACEATTSPYSAFTTTALQVPTRKWGEENFAVEIFALFHSFLLSEVSVVK